MSTSSEENERIEYNKVQLAISNLIIEIIEKNEPYKWIYSKEPFINKYNGKISYDNSGEVCKMKEEDLNNIIKSINKKTSLDFYKSHLEELLSEVRIDSWIPTYESNCGRQWISYLDILREEFNRWKYKNYELCDEDGNDIDENLDIELDLMFEDFIENASYEFYSAKLLKDMKKKESLKKKSMWKQSNHL